MVESYQQIYNIILFIKNNIENKFITSICIKIAALYENTFKNQSMSGKAMSEKPVTLLLKIQRRLIY